MANENMPTPPVIQARGIGFAGILQIIFIVLKLNPGGLLTTGIADWPWFAWWKLSVFCPLWYSFLIVFALSIILGIVISISGGAKRF